MAPDDPGDQPSGPAGLRRRPSGEAPPLPRTFDRLALVWLATAAILLVAGLIIGLTPRLRTTVMVVDGRIVEWFADHRTSAGWPVELNDLLRDWLVPVAGWVTLIVLVVARRFRHLVVWVGTFLVVGLVAEAVADSVARPRPVGVEITGAWSGASLPSPVMTAAALLLVSACFALAPAGRPRRRAEVAAALVLAVVGLLELWVGVAHPTDLAAGLLLGVSVPLLTFRWFAPDEVFPVSYGGGNAAHLDVTGERGQAIRSAVEAQLGVQVLDVRPIGLEGSAGSTPLRLTVADADTGDERPPLFAKLMARSHLRSDRWYKLGRTLLYGRLEDERRFTTVRRLVEREDYLGLRTEVAGVRAPKSLGVVEITPEREYLLVTEFLDGFEELGEADPAVVTVEVIDDAVDLIRRMWDAGLAHRDVKPANVMVCPAADGEPGRVALIDMGFAQVRPSPWRQAVDLANIMLVLSLPTDPATVYQRTLRRFSPEEVAEAFAATGGITVPTQLRTMIAADGRDLVEEFRRLAPQRPLIPIQRWTVRRVLLLVWVLVAALVAVLVGVDLLQAAGDAAVRRWALALAVGVVSVLTIVGLIAVGEPAPRVDDRVGDTDCPASTWVVLAAQSVPTAQWIPCLADPPDDWLVTEVVVEAGSARYGLATTDLAGAVATVELLPSCQVPESATPVEPDPDDPVPIVAAASDQSHPRTTVRGWAPFDGGCLIVEVDLPERFDVTRVLAELDATLTMAPRSAVAAEVAEASAGHLTLDPPP